LKYKEEDVEALIEHILDYTPTREEFSRNKGDYAWVCAHCFAEIYDGEVHSPTCPITIAKRMRDESC
jgi:hypothetical protein